MKTMLSLLFLGSVALASSAPKQSQIIQDQIAAQTDQMKLQSDRCAVQAAGSQTKLQSDQCSARAAQAQVSLDQLSAQLAKLKAAGN